MRLLASARDCYLKRPRFRQDGGVCGLWISRRAVEPVAGFGSLFMHEPDSFVASRPRRVHVDITCLSCRVGQILHVHLARCPVMSRRYLRVPHLRDYTALDASIVVTITCQRLAAVVTVQVGHHQSSLSPISVRQQVLEKHHRDTAVVLGCMALNSDQFLGFVGLSPK